MVSPGVDNLDYDRRRQRNNNDETTHQTSGSTKAECGIHVREVEWTKLERQPVRNMIITAAAGRMNTHKSVNLTKHVDEDPDTGRVLSMAVDGK